ncbi:hypothetical protein I6A75_16835 [Clostridioides difficile]|nr:hypothetical protein [Clostridioides difficile]
MHKTDLEWIKKYPWGLAHMQKQTYEMCIEAVKRQGGLLKDVRWDELNLNKKKIYNLCFIAVSQDGLALRFVKWNELKEKFSKEQLDKICIEAIKQNKYAIRYIKDKEKYENIFNFKYLKKQGKAKEVMAIKEGGRWRFTIGWQDNITKETFIYKFYKETFIDMIYTKGGGFDPEKGINVHRQVYLDFLKGFEQ